MIEEGALRVTEEGFELDVQLNWYRSLPLSSVNTVELVVNGEAVPRHGITFAVNDREYSLDELPARWEEMWFVLDRATLRVRRKLVRAGDPADVSLRLGTRIPYILPTGDAALEYVSEHTRTLVAR